jgi:Mlc titration factor MtfA (ptsG expression regulator)
MWQALRDWWRGRGARALLPEAAAVRAVAGQYPFLAGLSAAEFARLRNLAGVFLREKSIHGAAGLELDDAMRLHIAVQACLPVLNLGFEYYRGWVEVIVYPDEFLPEIEWTDEHGVVHVTREPRAGEAWLGGPVILSWADIAPIATGEGVNVVIHEFAHKLDMLNGDADGFPPLHRDMSRAEWSAAFGDAYRDFCARADADEETAIDPYAAETPGEFFAVMSEAFFEIPEAVASEYPQVYAQLVRFYRQDPRARGSGPRAADRVSSH